MDYAQRGKSISEGLSAAELAHLVIGQTLYLTDPRNTPVVVQACDAPTASFSVRVADFEDAGAIWVLPLWDVRKFRVSPHAQRLPDAATGALQAQSAAFDREMDVPARAEDRVRTEAEICALQREIDAWLKRTAPDLPTDFAALTGGRNTCPHWSAVFEKLLMSRGLAGVEQNFVTQYASNPNAGEMIKGHRIVLAELGLVPYRGHVVRAPGTFDGDGARTLRRAHILLRLAFMRTMMTWLGLTCVPLFRTIYARGALEAPRNSGFVSTTFCADVAEALFVSGQKTRVAATYWQQVPVERLFMSFLETPELSRRYQEAEAVLLFDPENSVF